MFYYYYYNAYQMFIILVTLASLVGATIIYITFFMMWEKEDYEGILANKVSIPGLTDYSNKNEVKEDEGLAYIYNPTKKRNVTDTIKKPDTPADKSTFTTIKQPIKLANTTIGKLTITILRGQDIKTGKSIFGLADPYASLNIGNQTKKTTVKVAGGLTPEWNEEIVFDITNEDSLNITIFDKETVDKDRFMAQCTCSIIDWIDNKTFEGSLNLVDKKNKSEGTLLISALFEPNPVPIDSNPAPRESTSSWI